MEFRLQWTDDQKSSNLPSFFHIELLSCSGWMNLGLASFFKPQTQYSIKNFLAMRIMKLKWVTERKKRGLKPYFTYKFLTEENWARS